MYFRVPTNKVECITGKNDERAHWIMHLTKTELTLPHRRQKFIFIIIDREDDVHRALRIVQDMANGDYISNGSHLDLFRKRSYTNVSKPSFKEDEIHYTLFMGRLIKTIIFLSIAETV
ncbi:unnamed protein product [Gongylonema pulchrum]|uniref:PHM7_ext domain-containing protein n=1 Tax=Gongylonema pulchrum TaxID=637853 RepID=A0A183CXM1_9BILA|nr:unnamed protein product [Gongylonema pulchrum]